MKIIFLKDVLFVQPRVGCFNVVANANFDIIISSCCFSNIPKTGGAVVVEFSSLVVHALIGKDIRAALGRLTIGFGLGTHLGITEKDGNLGID